MNLTINKKSIAFKISIYVCGFIILLQLISGTLSYQTENWLVNKVLYTLRQDVEESIAKQQKTAESSLETSMEFNGHMLASIVSAALYNMEDVEHVLKPFFEVKEVQAVAVFDDKMSPYGAAWKQDGIQTGSNIPDTFVIGQLKHIQLDSKYQDSTVGKVRIYYTDQLLMESFEELKEHTIEDFNKITASIKSEQLGMTLYLVLGLLLIVSVFLAIIFFLIRGMMSPIQKMVVFIEKMSRGKVDERLKMNRTDELGTMSDALDGFVDSLEAKVKFAETVAEGNLTTDVELASEEDALGKSLQKMNGDLNVIIGKVKENALTVSSSADQLSNISNQISHATTEMSSQSTVVSGAATEMSASVATMASSAEETSINIQSISATSTEMSQNMVIVSESMDGIADSINEVADKSKNSSDIAIEAKDMSDSATEAMSILSQSANEIGEVTEMIAELAQRTNLLALNANIEAASAGEAGKGFAVVANEIKELAKQSADSAQEIALKVTGIQDNTEKSEETILEMSKIVASISDSSNSITELAVEQAGTIQVIVNNIKESTVGVKDIARLIAEMSSGADESAKSSNELKAGSGEISRNMNELNVVITQTSKDVESVSSESQTLSGLSTKLEEVVNRFQLK